jgi:hypothetical protein
MGAEGLEPSRLHQSTDFHPPAAFAAALHDLLKQNLQNFENWTLPLPAPCVPFRVTRRVGSSRRVSAPSVQIWRFASRPVI